MITAIVALAMFGIIIMVHELGHFLTARIVGIHAEEFSIGMGPKIYQYKGKETIYSLRALPIGGYVKFIGEDEKSDDPRAFGNAKVWKRFLVLASGAGMNFVLGIILLAIFFMSVGVYEVSPDIFDVTEGSPAYEAGLKAGDRIVKVEGISIDGSDSDSAEYIEKFKEIINEKGNQEITITVERNGEFKQFSVVPQYSEEQGKYIIGVTFGRYRRFGVFKSLWMASVQTLRLIVIMVQAIGTLIFGGQGISQLTGPVGIVGEIKTAVNAGFKYILNLAIIITINLGIVNLIPFPALDGGRLALLIVEGIRGKPLPPEKEGYIHFIGFVLLMLLMIAVTFQDISRQWF